jgi:hypothetical protein
MQPRTRRVQRIHLAQPIVARLGASQVVVVDVSTFGVRVEHATPLIAGSHSRLAFSWEGVEISGDVRIVRSRLERFSVGADGLTVYHSGLEFDGLDDRSSDALKRMIGAHITRALEEQKLNARGVLPQHDPSRMPIFRRGGQLTVNRSDVEEAAGGSGLPTARMMKDTGYVCYHLENDAWRKKRTHDPGQPNEGFTISAIEDHSQAELLCEAYARSDREGRKLIQLFAQLSIMEGEGVPPGRFEP